MLSIWIVVACPDSCTNVKKEKIELRRHRAKGKDDESVKIIINNHINKLKH